MGMLRCLSCQLCVASCSGGYVASQPRVGGDGLPVEVEPGCAETCVESPALAVGFVCCSEAVFGGDPGASSDFSFVGGQFRSGLGGSVSVPYTISVQRNLTANDHVLSK